VYGIYRELELNLSIKPRSRIKREKPDALAVPAEINQAWPIDFMSNLLKDGRSIRTFNTYINRFNRMARHELLERNLFEDIKHAQLLSTDIVNH
jgi:hypothetical protein